MISVVGTYKDGHVEFDREYASEKPVRVIVTFLEDIKVKSERSLRLSDFNFVKSRKNLENFKGSLSDTVVEERRID